MPKLRKKEKKNDMKELGNILEEVEDALAGSLASVRITRASSSGTARK